MSDLISRQTAIEFVSEIIWQEGETWHDVQDRIVDGVSHLPSTDSPIGNWISQQSKDWKGGGAEICSECGYGYSWGAYHEPEEFKFCPNCGTRMEIKNG